MLWSLGRIHLSAHNTISSSPLCRVDWNTEHMYNACQSYSVERVSKMRSILIIISHAINKTVCYQLKNFPVSDCDICTLFYHNHQIGNMILSHRLGLGHERVVCAVWFIVSFECIATAASGWGISSSVMMTSSIGNIFHVTVLLCGEFTGHRWIPNTKARDAELWSFLWLAPEQTVEQTMETLVAWDAIALIMTSV